MGTGEYDFCECEQGAGTDVLDDGVGKAAVEADGVDACEQGVVCVLEHVAVDETVGGLYDS